MPAAQVDMRVNSAASQRQARCSRPAVQRACELMKKLLLTARAAVRKSFMLRPWQEFSCCVQLRRMAATLQRRAMSLLCRHTKKRIDAYRDDRQTPSPNAQPSRCRRHMAATPRGRTQTPVLLAKTTMLRRPLARAARPDHALALPVPPAPWLALILCTIVPAESACRAVPRVSTVRPRQVNGAGC